MTPQPLLILRRCYLFLTSFLMRTHGSKRQQNAVKNVPPSQMQKVYEALDTLGNTKRRVDRGILSVVEDPWAKEGYIGGLAARHAVSLPELDSDDAKDIKKLKWNMRKAKKTNQERHSLLCDIELKLPVYDIMKSDSIKDPDTNPNDILANRLVDRLVESF
ncbi:DNA-directed RNA polymerase 3A, chloroplastic [Castilleja foliolosa]|uniref:DNA-directed RNA polymerase 3A, chloroplastic n=1 Tax=Castilleja foliolosa TaxID=1961234 RepID=A0ABD3BX04_9LAMI